VILTLLVVLLGQIVFNGAPHVISGEFLTAAPRRT
jgi:hypothetical protein